MRQDIVQEAAEDLIAYMLESTARRDAEIKERLRRITALTELQRKALRKNGMPNDDADTSSMAS
jgi:hypothetical protein